MDRGAGILMPVFSLPNKYSIGSLGSGAYRFVDFLKAAKQRYWQMLPLVQTGFGDSPYQTVCSCSGNPYFIDLEILFQKGLLTKREVMAAIDKSERIDYGRLYVERYPLLRLAFSRFDCSGREFKNFLAKHKFDDYALFMSLKSKYNCSFDCFPDEYKHRDARALAEFKRENAQEIAFWQFLQFEFYNQWSELKAYANKNGIKIIGDLPLYVAYDSVEVWTSPENFMLDGYTPKLIAGVPPDYFSADGQLWGNPVYDYAAQREKGFDFWKSRLKHALTVFDYIRIDHFRGLDRFWAVPYGSTTAVDGEWLDAPGAELFEGIDVSKIIAEDLGLIDDGVRALLKKTGMPGMKVLSFAFGGGNDNPYLPWNVKSNCLYYTGTHDNQTVMGHIEQLCGSEADELYSRLQSCLDYFGIFKRVTGKVSAVDAFIDIVYASRANVSIVPMHDCLGFGADYRINVPATESGNWQVKYRLRLFTDTLSTILARKAKRFER